MVVSVWEPVSDPFDCAQDRLSGKTLASWEHSIPSTSSGQAPGDSVRFLTFAPLSTLAQSACVRGAMIILC